jgi:hypothetical protein
MPFRQNATNAKNTPDGTRWRDGLTYLDSLAKR